VSGSIDKEFRPLVKAARKAGWEVLKRKGNNHYAVRAPSGETTLIPTSSRGGKAVADKRATLRRMGLDI
jgi:predicted RNA binding protein YcfA (HicA-like mRNA interferase family)